MSKYEEKYLENVSSEQIGETIEDGNELQRGVKRSLQARHIQMIAIGGTIGTGLFLASGGNIYNVSYRFKISRVF